MAITVLRLQWARQMDWRNEFRLWTRPAVVILSARVDFWVGRSRLGIAGTQKRDATNKLNKKACGGHAIKMRTADRCSASQVQAGCFERPAVIVWEKSVYLSIKFASIFRLLIRAAWRTGSDLISKLKILELETTWPTRIMTEERTVSPTGVFQGGEDPAYARNWLPRIETQYIAKLILPTLCRSSFLVIKEWGLLKCLSGIPWVQNGQYVSFVRGCCCTYVFSELLYTSLYEEILQRFLDILI